MKKIGMLAAALILAGFASKTHAADQCGKVEYIYLHKNGAGAFAFKFTNFGTSFNVSYNSVTSPLILSQLLTAKASFVNVCVTYTGTNIEAVNVMMP